MIELNKKTQQNMSKTAYALMVMLGEIQNDMMKGEELPSLDEIDSLYGLAIELNDYFNDRT